MTKHSSISAVKAFSQNRRLSSEQGFSLLELVVAGLIGTILAVAAFSLTRSQTKAASDLANRLGVQQDSKQFLELRKKTLANATTASTLIGTPNMSLAPADRVYSGITIPRVRVNADGSTTNFTETFQTGCVTAPAGLGAIDNRINSCRNCGAGTLPVITDGAGVQIYPRGNTNKTLVSAALCVQQDNGITTLRLLNLIKKENNSTVLHTEEVVVGNSAAASRFQVLK